MRRVQTRAIGEGPDQEEQLSDWRTSQVLLTTVCRKTGVEFPAELGQTADLAIGVTIAAHPNLRARVTLEPFSEGKRDLGNLGLPALFRENPDLVQPFDLVSARGGDAGSSVILLEEVASHESVTPQSPLIIRADASLDEEELILPISYHPGNDPGSGLFLPLGIGYQDGDQIEIRIDRLPEPGGVTRDAAGSIRLFMQKVIAEKIGAGKFGLEDGTARLAVASLDESGRVAYDASPISLKNEVSKAERILLYIHGFVGDTRGMVTSAYGLKDDLSLPKLAEKYDLILSFDYENIYTPIEETAAALKLRLREAGLGPDHGKTVHVVAHSMGCVVTRWLIERDNGGSIIRKAVLVGPPNAGTPWAKIEDFVVIGLGVAINGLAALAWPPSVIPTLIGTLASLVGVVEKVDRTLDQLKPDDTFYRVLNASDDPELKYTVVAGNTSKIPGQKPETAEAEKGLFKKMVERLASTETRNQVLSLAFLNAPNDIAISVDSMISLPAGRNPEPDIVEVACDHVSYFNTEVGLRPIVEALLEN
jgi:pimeloyl-ACP methyl ester carboxylesterase